MDPREAELHKPQVIAQPKLAYLKGVPNFGRTIGGSAENGFWLEGQDRDLFYLDEIPGPPQVVTVQLVRLYDSNATANSEPIAHFIQRCGGVTTEFFTDFLHGQSISLVCDSVTVQARARAIFPDGAYSQFVPWKLAAFVGLGSIPVRARFSSQVLRVPASAGTASVQVPIPPYAIDVIPQPLTQSVADGRLNDDPLLIFGQTVPLGGVGSGNFVNMQQLSRMIGTPWPLAQGADGLFIINANPIGTPDVLFRMSFGLGL